MDTKHLPLDLETLKNFTLHSPLVQSIDADIRPPDGVIFHPDLPEMADKYRMDQFAKAGLGTIADVESALVRYRDAIVSYYAVKGRPKVSRKGICYISLVKAVYAGMESREDTVKGFGNIYPSPVVASDDEIEMWRALVRGDESWKDARQRMIIQDNPWLKDHPSRQ